MAEHVCRYFGVCGGCTQQDITYSKQLEEKKNKLSDIVKEIAVDVFSGKEYGYRNRMDYAFHKNGIGLGKKGRWDTVLDIKRCPIANDMLNCLLSEVSGYFTEADSFNRATFEGTLKYALIRTPTNDSAISFAVNKDSQTLDDAVERIRDFAKSTSAKNVVAAYLPRQSNNSVSIDYEVIKGKDTLTESLMGIEFRFPIQGFFQNNTLMADAMHMHCNKILKGYETSQSTLVDLYGGVGTFGIINSSLFKNVLIVESNPQSIDAAKLNIAGNGIKNAQPLCLDAKDIRGMSWGESPYLVVDPPRAGIHPKAIKGINELNPEVIVYVSCNTDQLGKDLQKLDKWSIKSAAVFDFFPQTPHNETVVELIRK